MIDSQVIDELLNDKSYHIEFNGHLTNHVKHAVVALAGLGASAEKIKAYYDNYAKLTPYGYGLEAPRTSKHTISEDNWERFFGKRTSYSSYCDFFDQKEKELGMDELLRRYLPPLLPGWVGSFTHATIHLGWALDVNHRWMTIEGLAYMAFSYVSCHPERASSGQGGRYPGENAVDSLLRLAGVWQGDHEALHGWVEALVADTASGVAAGIHPELARSGLQYRIARMAKEGHPLIYETPAWIESQDVSTSWEQLYYVTTLIYLAMPGNFVLLHLITSLHAMEQIANRLPEEQRKDVVRCFWIGMLCIMFSRADFPRGTKLAALHATFKDAVDDVGLPAMRQDWERIAARSFEEEEEHNPKLVYVLQRVWKRTGGRSIYRAAAAQFTTTPELPKSFEEPPTE
ncbi:questin oxidase family protein [Archangium minus]|uniref:Questin oxidase family protein n=1 Tax=Archangium minus TaxID=83450 RepID=A0ABY9WLS3_9BACT|nr:questin oxidase family protein [Archangium violaceum]WNG43380.1 questin oxidase family protein [Archangium minus]